MTQPFPNIISFEDYIKDHSSVLSDGEVAQDLELTALIMDYSSSEEQAQQVADFFATIARSWPSTDVPTRSAYR